ncbi:hypothetical protein A8H37_08450 [Burkholderia thailandensis]|nr:hypothetical protein A8H37_08450 [Burkholderia thailandensis]
MRTPFPPHFSHVFANACQPVSRDFVRQYPEIIGNYFDPGAKRFSPLELFLFDRIIVLSALHSKMAPGWRRDARCLCKVNDGNCLLCHTRVRFRY